MKRLVVSVGAGLVLCALACLVRADGLPGVYTYKLVLRDDLGFALNGAETTDGDGRVSSNYKIEVFSAAGDKIGAELRDWSLVDDRNTGCNCTLSVPVGEGVGYAKKGERLTLVVTTMRGAERFRSSKVLPPVGGTFGFADAPVGVFFGDADDTDCGWDSWLRSVGYYLPSGASLGGPDDDYDNDGLSNMREYQLGTDPAGGALGLLDGHGFTINEQGDAYKVSFNFVWGHVYSIRTIKGTATVGVDGRDLALYEDLDSLNSGSAWGTYFFDGDYNTGTKEFFVKKPTQGGAIGLAVDGRLQEYIQTDSTAVTVTPGFPIEYESQESAAAAKAMAEVVPSDAVAAVLAGDGASAAYKEDFTAEVVQKDGKWYLSAELTPEAWTNLMESATAATRQIPVAGIARLAPEATTNVVVTGCTPGFYYSLDTGAAVTNIAADAEKDNLNVLCGADGVVEFPKVSKPSETAGFYKVVTDVK